MQRVVAGDVSLPRIGWRFPRRNRKSATVAIIRAGKNTLSAVGLTHDAYVRGASRLAARFALLAGEARWV